MAVGSFAVPSLLLESEDLSKATPDSELAAIVSKLLDYGARQLAAMPRPTKPTPERKRRSSKRPVTFKEFVAQQQYREWDLTGEVAKGARGIPGNVVPEVMSEDDEPETVR